METKVLEYVDEELKPYIGYLTEFVERAELEKNVETLEIG
jgi:hypothetical protein